MLRRFPKEKKNSSYPGRHFDFLNVLYEGLAKVDFEFYFFDSVCFRLPITKKKLLNSQIRIFPFCLLVFSTFRIRDLLFILFLSTSYLFFSSTSNFIILIDFLEFST